VANSSKLARVRFWAFSIKRSTGNRLAAGSDKKVAQPLCFHASGRGHGRVRSADLAGWARKGLADASTRV
jgi:hypothetical protein